jgi:hypothetical protein
VAESDFSSRSPIAILYEDTGGLWFSGGPLTPGIRGFLSTEFKGPFDPPGPPQGLPWNECGPPTPPGWPGPFIPPPRPLPMFPRSKVVKD